jgi:hypothetical protein
LNESLWHRLDELTRGRVGLALIGLIILGLALVVFIMLGANIIRRRARHRPITRPREPSDWDAQSRPSQSDLDK